MRPLMLAAIAWVTISLVLATSAAAQSGTTPPLFRVEWDVPDLPPSMAKIVGYVHNDSAYAVTNVRVHVVALDGNGAPVEEEWGWVYGDIPADGRAFFAVPIVYPNASFTVTIGSFDVVARER